ncbi:MAG TPA: alpha/beta hydrolase [Jatrophihabitans sp.]|uniref:alpha/beta hydrolase n=1 Tax=Jatrophihabitans sp. TaxID=1932789 RepID=UPI002DF8155A|nr:alpha/beta hydrolase [Jatrophihabitans sp.]
MTDAPLDPAIADWTVRVLPGSEPATVEEARELARRQNAQALEALDPALVPASETDTEIPADGAAPAIPIRVLRPADESGQVETRPVPTVVYFHGGGWMMGDLDTHLGHARRICAQVHAVVVSVGYRLAPEHRFPAAFDDSLRAANWAGERLAELGGTDVLVLAGDSAGGQLAASVSIARRDAGLPVSAQLLLYPVTDVAGRYGDESVNAGYMSRISAYQRFGLTLETMATFAQAYVDEADSSDWRVSPKRASDLTGVAPAVIHTSTLDVLRTEGNFFGDDLRAAGVDVIAREHPSLNHSYFGLGGVSAVADAAAAQAADDLREILARA